MTEEAPHGVPSPVTGRGADPAARGGTIGAGLEPEESIEGAAEQSAHAAGPQPDEGLLEPGGVNAKQSR
jgi:hypothetical protein